MSRVCIVLQKEKLEFELKTMGSKIGKAFADEYDYA
jgi:hypothetical protein